MKFLCVNTHTQRFQIAGQSQSFINRFDLNFVLSMKQVSLLSLKYSCPEMWLQKDNPYDQDQKRSRATKHPSKPIKATLLRFDQYPQPHCGDLYMLELESGIIRNCYLVAVGVTEGMNTNTFILAA